MSSRPWSSRLLAWFDRAQRALPWRHDRDPYRIWVSEVMLQQTTVAAVIPFFHRFLERFPTIAALAQADEHDVLHAWAGLGYYRRARHLHAAARRLQAEHGGILPDDPEMFRQLPGVGRYILGAVLSQAFDRRLPILEANSLRVLARFLGYREDPRSSAGQRDLWQQAEACLPKKRVGDFNQALMELGALVCTPRTPDCPNCPLRRECVAAREGLQEVIPPPARRKAVTEVRELAWVARRGSRVLLVQRPETASRGSKLWEFPHGELQPEETLDQAFSRLVAEQSGLRARRGPEITTLRHTITRFRIEVRVFWAWEPRGRFRSSVHARHLWLTAEQLAWYPMSSPQRKLARAVARELGDSASSIRT